MKNVVERADKDKNKEVSIEEILTFDDFEFIESALPVVLELGIPYNSVDYLVRLNDSTSFTMQFIAQIVYSQKIPIIIGTFCK